jgi:hypothetical protein
MDFNEWINAPTENVEGDYGQISIYQRVMDGDYEKRRDILTLLEEAYEAGVASGIDAAMDYL